MPRIVRGDEVLAAAEVAETRHARRRGLLGREAVDGVLVLRPCRQVHTFGMRFPLEVAFCDGSGRVVRISRLARGRISPIVLRARWAIEAQSGTFDRWQLRPGDVLEVKE